jgi:hypothetical protein
MRRGLLAVVIVPLAAVALLAFKFDVAGTIRRSMPRAVVCWFTSADEIAL